MSSIIETIKQRTSVRTYCNREIEANIKEQIIVFLQSIHQGPFGNKVRFQLVEATVTERSKLMELGTYGAIKGAHLYIAGAVKRNDKAMEDFGYCMEKNILMATGLGLGACWLAGNLNRSAFGKRLNTGNDELIPAVTPLGYPADKHSTRDSIIRWVAGSKNRKSFAEIFFNGDLNTPLDQNTSEKYLIPLESVRLAPSASNKQPWRVIKEKGRNNLHFYLKENPIYNNFLKDIHIQNIDLGIALCHFELVARKLGLDGSWQNSEPKPAVGEWKYIASWIES
jgi:nitroreductase